ncbi:MAG: hypothetical protein ABI623_07990, partial [bacterium]
LLDKVIEQSGTLDVYIVGGPDELKSKRHVQLPEIHSGGLQYLTAAGVIVLVALVCFPFTTLLGYQTVALILLLAVALLPLQLGAGPVVLAAVLSALI